jgi:ethanolamine utilization protein EutN
VGAGIGEKVLIVTGSGARIAVGSREKPVDMVIVGIVD